MSERHETFDRMSRLLVDNMHTSFGGAAVVIPPGEDAVPIELFMIDTNSDPAQFYATLITRLQLAVQALEARNRGGFGR